MAPNCLKAYYARCAFKTIKTKLVKMIWPIWVSLRIIESELQGKFRLPVLFNEKCWPFLKFNRNILIITYKLILHVKWKLLHCSTVRIFKVIKFTLFFFLSGWLNERQNLKKFSDFRFLVEPSDTVAAKNNPVGPILHCAAETGDDYPKPTVKWRRDGQSLKFPDFNDRR